MQLDSTYSPRDVFCVAALLVVLNDTSNITFSGNKSMAELGEQLNFQVSRASVPATSPLKMVQFGPSVPDFHSSWVQAESFNML